MKSSQLAPQARTPDLTAGDASHDSPASVDFGSNVQGIAQAGVAGGGDSLPFLDQIQASFGSFDVGGVRAHQDSASDTAAGEIGASAYAMGNDVAFSSGGADLHTAAHEAAHVVQQRAGVSLYGGVGEAGDRYEEHADAVADKVVAGESAEGLLSEMADPSQSGSAVGGVQKRSTPITLEVAKRQVRDHSAPALAAAGPVQAAMQTMAQSWPAQQARDLQDPEVQQFETDLGAFQAACAAAPTTDSQALGASINQLRKDGAALQIVSALAMTALEPGIEVLYWAAQSEVVAEVLVQTIALYDRGTVQAEAASIRQFVTDCPGRDHAALLTAGQGLGQGLAVAVGAARYLSQYVDNPTAYGVALTEFSSADYDSEAADARMTQLAKYNYDGDLMSWTDASADTQVAQLRQGLETGRAEAESALPKDPGKRPSKARRKERPAQFKARQKAWDEDSQAHQDGQATLQGFDDQIASVEDQKPVIVQGMEGFIERATAAFDADTAQRMLRQANGIAPDADALLLMATALGADILGWAAGHASGAAKIRQATQLIQAALAGGCDKAFSLDLAVLGLEVGLTPILVTQTAERAVAAPGQHAELLQLVRGSQDPSAVLQLLKLATAATVSVTELGGLIDTLDSGDLRWALGKARTGGAAEVTRLIDLLTEDGVTQKSLGPILAELDATQTLRLFKRIDVAKPNTKRIAALLKVASYDQLDQLLTLQVTSDYLNRWFLTQNHDPDDVITLLGSLTPARLHSITAWTAASAADIIGYLGRLPDADTLYQIFRDRPNYPSPEFLVGAELSKDAWDAGGRATVFDSIAYHHNKHGAGKTVEQYTQDAQATWAAGVGIFDYVDEQGRPSKKIQGPPGGKYTNAGKIYTYWYLGGSP